MKDKNCDYNELPGGEEKIESKTAQDESLQVNASRACPEPANGAPAPENPQPEPQSGSQPPLPQTPMMLINEISKLFRDRIRDQNLQNSYRMLLFHLAIRGGRTQLELANMTHLKPPTISVTLQKMEADGYVRRVPNERDMRQTLVYLTEKGEEYNRNIRKKIDIIERNIASGFTDEELHTLMSLLVRIRDNIRQQERPVPPAE